MYFMTDDGYKNTYQRNLFVGENEFRMEQSLCNDAIPSFEGMKDNLPTPSWSGHETEIAMYWKAWKLAFAHIRRPATGSGFSHAYIDTAYNGNLFMWDSVFMTLFTKYAQRCFNFQGTLDDFYQKQHPDGFICREISKEGKDAFHHHSHGFLSWVDATLQQYIDGKNLLDFGFILERWQEIEGIEEEVGNLRKFILEKMWDEKKGFLFDADRNGERIATMHIGAFWALHTDILAKDQIEGMVRKLEDGVFSSDRPVPSLETGHPKFRDNGRYWQGGVWPSTNYMIMTGLQKQGYDRLANEIALKHITQVRNVFESTGTFWEYYSPTKDEPGVFARPEFVGWTGLSAISTLIEDAFGIRPDVRHNTIIWNVFLEEDFSLANYPYGKDGIVSFAVSHKDKKAVVAVESTTALTLMLNGKVCQVEKGKNEFPMKPETMEELPA